MNGTCVNTRTVDVIDLSVTSYSAVYNLQKELIQKRLAGTIEDTLLIVEHPPVFTIGRTGSKDNLLTESAELSKNDIEVIETDRGGDITFHGPGQLVLYPILNLGGFKKDISEFIRRLEDVIIMFLSFYKISGYTIKGASGVWIDKNKKIGSIGIGITKWISYHGFSVNINTSLPYFDMINPCGLKDCNMVSLSSLLNSNIKMGKAKSYMVKSFENVFRTWKEQSNGKSSVT